MQPFQCDHANTETQETHRTTYTGTSSRCKAHWRNNSRMKRPQPHPPHRRGTFHRRLQPLYTEKHKVSCAGFLPTTKPMQHSCSHSNAISQTTNFKKRIELRTQDHPVVAKHIGGTIRAWNDPSRTRRTDEVPFIVACSHFTRKNARFRAPASSPQQSPCMPMQYSCSHSNAIMQTQRLRKRIELRTQEHPVVAKHIEGTIRAWNDPSRTRRTDEVPFIAGCSHFTRKNPRFRAPASSPKHIHFPSSPLPFVTTSLRHHSPSSSLPFFTASLRHHFPSSPLPFLTTSLRHHSPSSSLPQGQFHSFLFFCYVLLYYVLLYYVLLYDLPPFLKVNFVASYWFVMYWYIMYCYRIYHPSS